MTHGCREIVIRNAITSRLAVVISGGSELGKTTLANAVIAEIVETAHDDRILLILEDTAEMQCAARERRSAAYQRRDRHGAAAEEHDEVSA